MIAVFDEYRRCLTECLLLIESRKTYPSYSALKIIPLRRLRQRPGLGPSAEVLSFASPKDKYPKKRRPDCLRPYATFHFAPGKPTSHNSDCGAPQLTSRLWRCVQTNGRKPDHEALALFGANAHSLNCVPQAQPDGGSGRPAGSVTKLA